jgi:hypothetical protein
MAEPMWSTGDQAAAPHDPPNRTAKSFLPQGLANR